jgi:hypothetical protein
MGFPIHTYVGAGPLRFGMTREEVQAALGSTPKRFRRTPSGSESDHFTDGGVLVYYDHDGRCEAIEMDSRAAPNVNGRALVGLPFRDLLEWFTAADPGIETDGAGLISRGLGIALYAPAARKEPDDPVEAAMAFRRGYYDT